jgi:hypothetical protein
MQGFIQEQHLDSAESAFPGIQALYLGLAVKPQTFLELVWEYQRAASSQRCAPQWPDHGPQAALLHSYERAPAVASPPDVRITLK